MNKPILGGVYKFNPREYNIEYKKHHSRVTFQSVIDKIEYITIKTEFDGESFMADAIRSGMHLGYATPNCLGEQVGFDVRYTEEYQDLIDKKQSLTELRDAIVDVLELFNLNDVPSTVKLTNFSNSRITVCEYEIKELEKKSWGVYDEIHHAYID